MSKPCFMYHPAHGKKLFDADKQNMNQLEAEGWVDNPGKIDGSLPGYKPAAEPMPDKKPDPQPQSEPEPDPVNDQSNDQQPVSDYSEPATDQEPTTADGRTTQPVFDVQELMAIFNAEPTRLTVEELVQLGQSHNIDVRRNWKEETLIAKIRQGLNSVNN